LNLVRPTIEKKNTLLKETIPAHERLALTLRFLANGEYKFDVLTQNVKADKLNNSSRSEGKYFVSLNILKN
jgi:hypothetical protein